MNNYTRWSDKYTEKYIQDKITYYDRQLKYFDNDYKDRRNHLALRAKWRNKLKIFYEKNPM